MSELNLTQLRKQIAQAEEHGFEYVYVTLPLEAARKLAYEVYADLATYLPVVENNAPVNRL